MRRRGAAAGLCAILATLVAGGSAGARVEMTQDQALRLAFPPPQEVERRTLYLDETQVKEAGAAAGVPVEARVVPYYVGRAEGRVTGFAYFDTHLVRTLPETIMIRLTPSGTIRAIDILSFDEPQDYRVTARWLEQFQGRDAGAADRLPEAIRSLSGATLSARAITDAARRILALHRLFVQPHMPAPQSPP